MGVTRRTNENRRNMSINEMWWRPKSESPEWLLQGRLYMDQNPAYSGKNDMCAGKCKNGIQATPNARGNWQEGSGNPRTPYYQRKLVIGVDVKSDGSYDLVKMEGDGNHVTILNVIWMGVTLESVDLEKKGEIEPSIEVD